jgi:acyl-CoA synthetase (AMP-forming)/AMP-acid ligase II
VGTPLPPALHDAFLKRFGVPLRQGYSSTETGPICLDVGPPERIERETVGTPIQGVEVRVGDDPTQPFAPDRPGRIWVRGPGQMAGYGFPPAVERPGDVDGWWPTQDLGRLRADGYLVLAGRIDDAIRTRDNRVVNLAHVAASFGHLPGVREVVVMPIDGPGGRSFGAVVECDGLETAATLRAGLASVLPPWSWPRVIEQVAVLPRLPNGKPDRNACARLLAERTTP